MSTIPSAAAVARYIGRHDTKRVAIGAVPPVMIKSDNKPGGT